YVAVAPSWKTAKLFRTGRQRLISHRLKHLEILIAFLAVILIGRHARTLPRREHNSSRRARTKFPPQSRPLPLTFESLTVKGSTEKFLCVVHLIGCCSSRFFQARS